ncbi:MAG: thioredoxin [Verrucomicrobia bacterium]|nr:thioredoxin [Prolixibacteraceae bacterium]
MNKRFSHIIKSQRPVLVDFYADWCVPCRLMPPILKELKEQYKSRIRIVKVNVDNHPDIASSCQVQNIPAIVLFYDGKIRWSGVGVQQVDDIAIALKEII